jgi:small ligand-binding sensory domain FIST
MKRLILISLLAFMPLAFAADQTVSSTAYEASHVLKTGPGTLISVLIYNSKAGAQFIQLHDAASLPANGATPALVFEIPASSARSFDVPVGGMPFTTGITVCNSSTANTKTIGLSDCYFTAVVR